MLIKNILHTLPENLVACFRGYNLLWYLLAAALTWLIVVSGLDWTYFLVTRSNLLQTAAFIPDTLGFIVPVVVPLALYYFGKRRKNIKAMLAASAIAQAEVIGWLISSFLKIFTGRIQPALFAQGPFLDISREFQFGLFRHGIFWGWPSSHTTVAFAMAFALCMLYPKNWQAKYMAPLYALFIGLGVSVSIHWFSDFVAGAIIGSSVGIAVGKSFLGSLDFKAAERQDALSTGAL